MNDTIKVPYKFKLKTMQRLFGYVKLNVDVFLAWEYNLSLLIRIFCFTAFLMLSTVHDGRAADVPVTFEDALGIPLPPGARERNTCDPEFWDVLTNRAWEEGQREISQNQNLIARPDSVLSMTCFDSSLNHLAWYADNNFPGDPDESRGDFLGGTLTNLIRILPDQAAYGVSVSGTQGYLMYATLELLVLDQLTNNVTDAITQAADLATILPCTGKEYYIHDNFPELMIGDRAVADAPWAAIPSQMQSNVSRTVYNGCQRMNDVWQRSKCYDFATESRLDITPPPADLWHDGFYTLGPLDLVTPPPWDSYKDKAEADEDYRMKEMECKPPDDDGSPDFPSATDLACDVRVHGIPATITPTYLINLLLGNTVPTWDTAHANANPDPGTPGAMDQYDHFLGLRDTAACAPPIKIGYIVTRDGSQYIDAVCPAPGCFFNPPSTLSGNGTCN